MAQLSTDDLETTVSGPTSCTSIRRFRPPPIHRPSLACKELQVTASRTQSRLLSTLRLSAQARQTHLVFVSISVSCEPTPPPNAGIWARESSAVAVLLIARAAVRARVRAWAATVTSGNGRSELPN